MAPDPLLSHCNGYAPTSARVCCRDCDWFLTTAAAEGSIPGHGTPYRSRPYRRLSGRHSSFPKRSENASKLLKPLLLQQLGAKLE
uniref:Uncharacterized protein n=1 Tax=Oryza glumipatula TaxID=40148 RepID=A0A0D9YUB9_9ORYZ